MNFSTKFLAMGILLAVALISGTTWGLAQGPPDNPGPPDDPGPPGKTLATLDCSAGEIAKFDGNEWICAEDRASPLRTVVFFDRESCPEGWSELTEAQGRALVGLTPGGTLGGTVGNPLDNLENRTHNHAVGPVSIDTHLSGDHSHEGSTGDAGAHSHEGSTASAGAHSHQGSTELVEGHSHEGTTEMDGAHSHGGSTETVDDHTHGGWTESAASDHWHYASMGGATNDLGVARPFLSTGTAVSKSSHTHPSVVVFFGSFDHSHFILETTSAGAHAHTVSTGSAGDHDHLLNISSAAAHAHPVTINSGGDHSHAVSTNHTGDHSHAVGTNIGGEHNHAVEVPNTISTEAATGNVMPYLQLLVCRKD